MKEQEQSTWRVIAGKEFHFKIEVEGVTELNIIASRNFVQNFLVGGSSEELDQFFTILARQPNGEKGDLLTNGDVNIKRILDSRGYPWNVSASWHDTCWFLAANPFLDAA